MKTHKTFFMTKRLIYFVSVNCPFSDAFFMTYVVVVIHFVLNVKIRRHFYALSHINFVLTVPMCSCRTEKIIVLGSLYWCFVLYVLFVGFHNGTILGITFCFRRNAVGHTSSVTPLGWSWRACLCY